MGTSTGGRLLRFWWVPSTGRRGPQTSRATAEGLGLARITDTVGDRSESTSCSTAGVPSARQSVALASVNSPGGGPVGRSDVPILRLRLATIQATSLSSSSADHSVPLAGRCLERQHSERAARSAAYPAALDMPGYPGAMQRSRSSATPGSSSRRRLWQDVAFATVFALQLLIWRGNAVTRGLAAVGLMVSLYLLARQLIRWRCRRSGVE
jgi:hypothetical protein